MVLVTEAELYSILNRIVGKVIGMKIRDVFKVFSETFNEWLGFNLPFLL